MMSIPAKISIVLALILALLGYGHWQNKKGYRQAQLEAKAAATDLEIKYRAEEKAAQKKADNNYAEYEAQKLVTQKSSDSLATTANSLREQLALYKRRLSKAASNPKGAIATGEAGFDVLSECTERYSELGKETARLADKVNGLVGQIQTKPD